MFTIHKEPINIDSLTDKLRHDQAGAFATFEGRVRDHNDGRKVRSLEYDAYPELCENEAQRIVTETKQKFEVIDFFTAHRYGHLSIGDVALWVGVSSAHRREAFEAVQYLVNEIKHRLPIWKREHYVSGEVEWVACHRCAHPDTKEFHPGI